MESTDTTATNSDANECCIGRTLGKIRPRKVGATSAQAQGLARKKGVSACKSAAGFLLLDSSLSIVSFNGEAVQILSYPDNVENLTSSGVLLTETIQSRLITQPSPGESVFVKRSEEHTSELQSLTNLVCRLLLEKKKKSKNAY